MNDSNFFYYIRDWLLAEPRIRELLKVDEREFIPVFPAQQFPESEFPYVRYSMNNSILTTTPWMNDGDVFLFAWFENLDNAQEFYNIVYDMCAFGPDSAGELSRWLAINNIECPYVYHSIAVPMSGDVQPTTERGGASSYAISLKCIYSPRVYRDRYEYARQHS